ncbi:MAG TPA: EF-hand domain-containing protein [Chthonomonadaceae bacterium]|nr:EF-hand domain-containing protein [Chthonomonadaceae bacterium]
MKSKYSMLAVGGMALAGGVLLFPTFTRGQAPFGTGSRAARQDRNDAQLSGVDAFVARLMIYDKNKDGKITRDEMTDERLQDLFDRADTNKDGVVTREELVALYEREAPGLQAGGNGGPPGGFGGPGGPPPGRGFGGPPPGGFGPGGPGGPGFGGPSTPGQVLPDFLQQRLNLTDAQKKQVAKLQKDVDARLDKILTADQKKQLKALRNRRPGGPGGFGSGGPPPGGFGPGGPGGFGLGGPPPGGPDGAPPNGTQSP